MRSTQSHSLSRDITTIYITHNVTPEGELLLYTLKLMLFRLLRVNDEMILTDATVTLD